MKESTLSKRKAKRAARTLGKRKDAFRKVEADKGYKRPGSRSGRKR